MYSDKNERFVEQFPGWQAPVTERLERFSDLMP
jgi:hypothetical protein